MPSVISNLETHLLSLTINILGNVHSQNQDEECEYDLLSSSVISRILAKSAPYQ